jgi:hypothetical protein
MSNDYEVGYAKPPKKHQFKKGQSGNPRGRPPKEPPVRTLRNQRLEFFQAMEQQMTVNVGGKRRKMKASQVIDYRLVAKAAKGDHRAIKLAKDMYRDLTDEHEQWQAFFWEMTFLADQAEEEEWRKSQLEKKLQSENK